MPMTGGPSDTMLPPDIIPAVPPVVVLIGELNPYSGDPRYALYDEPERASGHRLRTVILGLERRTYLDGSRIERGDLCVGRWTIGAARSQAARVLVARTESRLVLLGRKVASAFGFGDVASFTVRGHCILLPHPSGLCREWHRPGAVDRARELLRREVPAIPWGELDP